MKYPEVVTFTNRPLVRLPLGSAYGWLDKKWFDVAIERGVLRENEYGQFAIANLELFLRFNDAYEKWDENMRKNDEQKKIVQTMMKVDKNEKIV